MLQLAILYFYTANWDAGSNIANECYAHLSLHYKSWRVYGSLKVTSFATQKSYSRESSRHESVSVLIAA